jgi:hypothetical protein
MHIVALSGSVANNRTDFGTEPASRGLLQAAGMNIGNAFAALILRSQANAPLSGPLRIGAGYSPRSHRRVKKGFTFFPN